MLLSFDKLRMSGVGAGVNYRRPLSLSLSKAMRGLALGLILMVGTAGAQAPLKLPEVDYIRVEKAARTMVLYAAGQPVHTITGIQLGDAPAGHKQFQGDEKTPEGRYTIDYGNDRSAYHLSLHISYPNARDTAYARAQGRSPGGLIFIHGQPNDWVGGGKWRPRAGRLDRRLYRGEQ